MKRSNEPIFWGLFGAGGMVAAILTPVCILITGLLIPLGAFDSNKYSFERASFLAGHWLGALVLLIVISLPMWHGMHRIYHGLHDIGVKTTMAYKLVCYGIALVVTIATAVLLLQLLSA
ncbi:fumarate reductase subunit FrdD [Celerinatantimonas yamalensis]|uniref:Fumarate reductase subunit D n=1 Tax=Celerinatantimonas yamalensis TaxID=559956 RepID=A0ABW9G5C0_9GAMM